MVSGKSCWTRSGIVTAIYSALAPGRVKLALYECDDSGITQEMKSHRSAESVYLLDCRDAVLVLLVTERAISGCDHEVLELLGESRSILRTRL